MTTYDAASPTALLFNITKGSFVDGYGIRTTIFLKGLSPEVQVVLQRRGRALRRSCGCSSTAAGVAVSVCRCVRKGADHLGWSGAVDRAKCTGCGRVHLRLLV